MDPKLTEPDSGGASDELLPCPFCGGEAEIIEIDDGESAGGSCICCTRCMASSNVEFECKENFVDNWNRRSDLCASGQQVREAAHRILELYDDAMRDLLDPGAHDTHPDSDEMAELRRIVGALTPAPQAEEKISAEALIDLIGELGREVYYLLDDCETSGPVGEEVHTITPESLEKVSALLDRIDALPFAEPGVILGIGAKLQAALKQTFMSVSSAATPTAPRSASRSWQEPTDLDPAFSEWSRNLSKDRTDG